MGLVTFFLSGTSYNGAVWFEALGGHAYADGGEQIGSFEPPPKDLSFVFGQSFEILLSGSAYMNNLNGWDITRIRVDDILITDMSGNPLPNARLVVMPEPATFLIAGIGLGILIALKKRLRD
jgi:hypothetical protein